MTPFSGRITVSAHARRQLIRRMGTGCNPDVVARRAWEKGERTPAEWKLPVPKGPYRYLKYGDNAMIFALAGNTRILVTCVGPLSANNPWRDSTKKADA